MLTSLKEITLDYYNKNASEFYNRSVHADMNEIQSRFLKYLPNPCSILDFGCGSGRDMKVFLNKGYRVDGIDGSKELAKLARKETGKNIEVITFDLYHTDKKYDGIWACASLLHFPIDETLTYLTKLINSLNSKGILYFSLKKGNNEGIQNGRYFKYYSRKEIDYLLQQLEKVKLIDFWESEDSRPTENNIWFNVILQKNE